MSLVAFALTKFEYILYYLLYLVSLMDVNQLYIDCEAFNISCSCVLLFLCSCFFASLFSSSHL